MIFNQFFFTFLCRYWPVVFVTLHHLSTYIFNTVKKNFPECSLSVTGLCVCLLIDRLCAYRFANSHHTVLHIIGSLFYTCSLFYHTPFRLFNRFLIHSSVGFAPLCYCSSSFSNVFSFYTSTYFLWHAVTILITSWPALRFLSLYVILLIVSCYWYTTCFVVENIAMKKPTWIVGRNVGW